MLPVEDLGQPFPAPLQFSRTLSMQVTASDPKFMQSLFGIDVHTSWLMEPNGLAYYDPSHGIVMHPLDLLAVERKGRPLSRLDAAMALLVRRACARLDAAIERLADTA